MKLYDRVKQLLNDKEYYRNSDKALIWAVWNGETGSSVITREMFMRVTSPESITRAKRKVVENHPELRSKTNVQEFKDKKESMKGNHVFFEDVKKMFSDWN